MHNVNILHLSRPFFHIMPMYIPTYIEYRNIDSALKSIHKYYVQVVY